MTKVAYYNMPGDISYEKHLLDEWNINRLIPEIVRGDDILNDLQGYEGLVTEYTILDENTLRQLPDLKIIALQSVGFDEIDIVGARSCDIDVTNSPGYCTDEVATHAMALLLCLVRKIAFYDSSTHEGKWDPYEGATMHSLRGMTAGLFSFGRIAMTFANMLKAFGVRVIAYDPSKSAYFMKENGVEKIEDPKELVSQSDIISLHSPLNSETYHMIDKEILSACKDNAILINTARGALIDEDALYETLLTGKISMAGLDVLEDEKSHNSKLFKLNNVIITPHAAFLSKESMQNCKKIALKQLVAKLIRNEMPENLVN